MRLALLFMIFSSIWSLSLAQDEPKCPKVLLSGKVMDTLRTQNFYNLMIVNRTSGVGVFGMPTGGYSLYVEEGDSITFSIKPILIQYQVFFILCSRQLYVAATRICQEQI